MLKLSSEGALRSHKDAWIYICIRVSFFENLLLTKKIEKLWG